MSIKVIPKFLLYDYIEDTLDLDDDDAVPLSEYYVQVEDFPFGALIEEVKRRLNALLTWEFEGETSVVLDEEDRDIYTLRREGTSEAEFKELIEIFNTTDYCALDDKRTLFGRGNIHLDIVPNSYNAVVNAAGHEIEYDDDADEAEEGADPKTTCRFAIGMFDKDITKHLRNPTNFILQIGNENKECESLTNLRKQYTNAETGEYDIFYECSRELMERVERSHHTPLGFSPRDFYTDREYVKVGSTNFYIEKPDWIFDGIPPEPRIFKLEKIGEKFLVEKRIAEGRGLANVVSSVHCDLKDKFDIHRLVPVDVSASASEGGKKYKKYSKKQKLIKKKNTLNKKFIKKRKISKKKKTLKKKNKKYTKKRTTT